MIAHLEKADCMKIRILWALLIIITATNGQAQKAMSGDNNLHTIIDQKAAAINDQVVQWRRHFHEFPELSNREFKTADAISKYLMEMGYQVDRGFAKTGVVALLDTGKPGPTIGLRADIDGLPVTERTPIPFASKETSTYLGQEVGVMHACGHDTHISMLLGAASILKDMKNQLNGKIVFVFQPAEEGAPAGEEGGAASALGGPADGDHGNPRIRHWADQLDTRGESARSRVPRGCHIPNGELDGSAVARPSAGRQHAVSR